MRPWLALAVAGCASDPAPPEPSAPRVLEGPLLGAGLAVVEGAVWVGAPGADGVGAVARVDSLSGEVALASASRTVTGEGLSGAFAWCPDWDGRPALAVGSPARGDSGRAWLVVDPPAGETPLQEQPSVESRGDGARTGDALACGDLDGDGRSDLAVSSPGVEGIGPSSGRVTVYRELDGGLEAFASVDTAWSGAELGYRTGSLAGIDLGGDGAGDLVVAGSGSDRVHVLAGPLQGSYLTNSVEATLQGEDGDAAGFALAVGDLTGDGRLDLVVGAPGASNGKGRVWVVPGPVDASVSGLLRNHALRVEGISQGARAGSAVAVPGDVDGDGLDDLLVGAPFAGGVGEEAGAAYLLLGSQLGEIETLDEAAALFLGEVPLGRLGWAVAGGDVDGDGAIELLVSAPEADVDGVVGAGQVWSFSGDARGTLYPDAAEGRIHR